MGDVVKGAAVAAAAGFITGGFGFVGGQLMFQVQAAATHALIAGGSTLVAGGLSSLLREDPREDFSSEASGRTQMVRQPAPPRVIVYGKTKKSGPMLLAETTGEKNRFLHLVIYLSEGPIEAIDTVFLNEDELTLDGNGNDTGKYGSNVRIKKHVGSDSQTADTDLVNEVKPWTTDHRLRGMAYLYARLKFDRDIFPGGIPNISAIVKGRNDISDPRDGSTGYTTNPALILNDYMRDSTVGMGANDDEVDDDAVKTAANVCEEQVDSNDRYTTNGIVDSSTAPQQILEGLTNSMQGRLVWTEGQFVMQAGEWTSPVASWDEDTLASTFEVQAHRSKQELFNAIRGTYVSPDNNWQLSDFPPITNSTFETNDNGERIWENIELRYTIDAQEAQRIARIELEKIRHQKTIPLTLNLDALETQVGDTIQFSFSRYGWNNKTFRIIEWGLGFQIQNGSVNPVINVLLREEDSSVWTTQTEATVPLKSPVVEFA